MKCTLLFVLIINKITIYVCAPVHLLSLEMLFVAKEKHSVNRFHGTASSPCTFIYNIFEFRCFHSATYTFNLSFVAKIVVTVIHCHWRTSFLRKIRGTGVYLCGKTKIVSRVFHISSQYKKCKQRGLVDLKIGRRGNRAVQASKKVISMAFCQGLNCARWNEKNLKNLKYNSKIYTRCTDF